MDTLPLGPDEPIPVPSPALLRPEEAARLMRIGRTKVYDLMREGSLRSVKVGEGRRVSAGDAGSIGRVRRSS